MPSFKLAELVKEIGGELLDPSAGELEIFGVAPLDKADPQQLSFLTNPKYAAHIKDSQAAAVLVAKEIDASAPLWIHPNPYAAMASASLKFYTVNHTFKGQSELAYIHPEATVHNSATIYPFAYIEKEAVIEEGVVLYPHVVIQEKSTIGKNSVLYPSVTVMHECAIGDNCILHAGCVIGADGFGFAPSEEGNVKIPQIGKVRIGNNVELQAGCTIDRGALTDTIIGDGTKMDDQVLIAHGVELGEHCLVAGQGAIAGSTKIGNRFIMAGCGAVGPSLQITDNVVIGPKGGVTASLKESGEYIGFPVTKGKNWRKQTVAIRQLPKLVKTINELKTRLETLEAQLSNVTLTK